ncbi:MAG TPA: chromosome segregation protein SMC [Acidimicrobiales bacterium]
MFLKALTLKGFKSFAEPTTLELEPGVTVVVGPNGSGKSNVVDAVAWVLGAQGPRTVRSARMDDVIFAGSAKRPALGRAEVSLTIDNSSGLLPVESSEITLSRTLFRSGDSEYAINGVPCRLLDVQELLSDSGVGRQQHVIVGQGQLDAVLNARPEDRRLIVEEAAGVLKYRRRRERAERRLEATEGNLERLQDLLGEVRRQIRPLERQAQAALRHAGLADELHAVRLFLAGRDLANLEARLTASRETRADLDEEQERLKVSLAGLDTSVIAAESALTSDRGDDLVDHLRRVESLRERALGMSAVLAERRRSIASAASALADQDVVAALEAEAARLRSELEQTETSARELEPAGTELAAAELTLAGERADLEETLGDAMGLVSRDGAAADARGQLRTLRHGLDRDRAEWGRLESRLAAIAHRTERLEAERRRLRDEIDAARRAAPSLTAAAEDAATRRSSAESGAERAEAGLRRADQDHHSWQARADALALALDEARARAGAERLSEVPGVIGTLLELVEVDAGWERAFEAAAGEAVAAVVMAGPDDARTALGHLREAGTRGAVLALCARGHRAVGVPADLAGVELVRSHVRSAVDGVEHLLDVLLGDTVVAPGGWDQAVDLALSRPELIVVTVDGDRFGLSGWRIGGGGPTATRAALEEARSRAARCADGVATASEDLQRARVELAAARAAETERAKDVERADASSARAGEALTRAESELGVLAQDAQHAREQEQELARRIEHDASVVASLEQRLPTLEADEAEVAQRVAAAREAKAQVDERVAVVAQLRTDLEVRTASLDERRSLLAGRLGDIERRLERDRTEAAQASERRQQMEAAAIAIDRLSALVTGHVAALDDRARVLGEQRRQMAVALQDRAAHLDRLRDERLQAERRLAEIRERAQRAEIEDAEIRLRQEAAVESVRRDLDREPEVAMAAPRPEPPAGVTIAQRGRELERELRLMGPVNPLAVEELNSLRERHEFLESQLEDVRGARRELAKVIRAIDGEIVQVFAAAFADVSKHFSALFSTLFSGGVGGLRLTDPDNLLETGIEVEAKPAGKNVKKLSLLSGGERALVAIAFLFSVFRSRPSPFYLLDEVEAALDDVNLRRFLDLIEEFRDEAQLIVVTHQKRTMESADWLYGVTLQPGGSSKIVSERVRASA